MLFENLIRGGIFVATKGHWWRKVSYQILFQLRQNYLLTPEKGFSRGFKTRGI
jgi:hypothetical protein